MSEVTGLANLELVLGGARSGKSRLAQRRAEEDGRALVYIATATAGDDEMSQRIARHKQDRCPLVSGRRAAVAGRGYTKSGYARALPTRGLLDAVAQQLPARRLLGSTAGCFV